MIACSTGWAVRTGVRRPGLSCYYSYNGDVDDFNGYAGIGAGLAFKYFYAYELTGELDDSGMEYIADMDFTELPKVENLLSTDWDGKALDVNGDGVSYLTLGPEADDILAGIGFSLYYVDEENDVMLLLGYRQRHGSRLGQRYLL